MQPDNPYHLPKGFCWHDQGKLAGLAQPGGDGYLMQDIAGLEVLGIKLLISLTEEHVPDNDLFAANGIEVFHLPIKDMCPPSIPHAALLCEQISNGLNAAAVAVHCKAGKGRTGTVLAAYGVWLGKTAADSVATCRKIKPDWIETQSQLRFLGRFESHLRN